MSITFDTLRFPNINWIFHSLLAYLFIKSRAILIVIYCVMAYFSLICSYLDLKLLRVNQQNIFDNVSI